MQALDRVLEPPALDAAANAAHTHAVRAGLTDRYREKLRDGLGLPVVDIPFLSPAGDFGRPAIEAVAALVARAEEVRT
jgi:hypothetical protein